MYKYTCVDDDILKLGKTAVRLRPSPPTRIVAIGDVPVIDWLTDAYKRRRVDVHVKQVTHLNAANDAFFGEPELAIAA